MTKKIEYLEDIIASVMEYQKNRGELFWCGCFTIEEGELILAALSVYRKKWEEVKENK